MSYDRDAAINYAKKYWDRPCDDGVFWRSDYPVDVAKMRKVLDAPAKDGWQALFVPDGKDTEHAVFQRSADGKIEEKEIQEWAGLADCAHFLTRCISAGGLPMKEISVPKMIEHLKKRLDIKVLAEHVTRVQGQRIVDSGFFKQADMLGYFNIDPNGDYGGRHQYSHSTMYVGKISSGDVGRITCHTKSRFAGLSTFPDAWHLESDSYTYTFIHIARDDRSSLTLGSKLVGWWRGSEGAPEYYYLTAGGRAHLTLRPPATLLGPPAASYDSACWFLRGGQITLFWRKGGAVEVWTPSGHADQFTTTVNGLGGGAVSRMTHMRRK